MPQVIKNLAQAIIPTSVNTIYTVPPATVAIAKEISFCNTTNSIVQVNLYFVQTGDSAGVKNSFLINNVLIGYETQVYSLNRFLNAGTTIQVISNTLNAVGIEVSGVEMS